MGIAAPAQAIVPVADAADDADPGDGVSSGVSGGGRGVGIAVGNIDQAAGVGRPSQVDDTAGGVGELAGFAAIHRDEPDLAWAGGGVGAEEGDGLTVRGETGRAVFGAGGKVPGGAGGSRRVSSGQVKDAEAGAAFQSFRVGLGVGEYQAGTVRGEGRVGYGLETVGSVGANGLRHRGVSSQGDLGWARQLSTGWVIWSGEGNLNRRDGAAAVASRFLGYARNDIALTLQSWG